MGDQSTGLEVTEKTKIVTDTKTIKSLVVLVIALVGGGYSLRANLISTMRSENTVAMAKVKNELELEIAKVKDESNAKITILQNADHENTQLILSKIEDMKEQMIKQQETADTITQLKLQNLEDKIVSLIPAER